MKSLVEAKPQLPRRWWVSLQLLLAGALGISLFLLWGSWSGEQLPGCGAESGCGTVLNSRWAYLFGLPVSLPAAMLYISMLAALSLQRHTTNPQQRLRSWYFLCFGASAIITAALWFVVLQLFVIHAICRFCMVAHGCGASASLLLLTHLPQSLPQASQRKKTAVPQPLLSRRVLRVLTLAGAAASVLMALGQIVHQPKSFAVQPMISGSSTIPQAVPQSNLFSMAATQTLAAPLTSTHATPPPPPHHLLTLHNNAFSLDLDDLPLLGSPQATQVVVHLFDYSCHYCRQLHPILVNASHQWSNDLAIVSLPMPMSSNCNPIIRRFIPAHSNACEYARIGLAVWRAQPDKLHKFDDWIFAPPVPPSPEAVQAEAIRLVGSNAFYRAFQDPWIQQQLNLSIRLFSTNRAIYGKGNLPQLIIGSNLITGVVRSNDFSRLLGRSTTRLQTNSQPTTNHLTK